MKVVVPLAEGFEEIEFSTILFPLNGGKFL